MRERPEKNFRENSLKSARQWAQERGENGVKPSAKNTRKERIFFQKALDKERGKVVISKNLRLLKRWKRELAA